MIRRLLKRAAAAVQPGYYERALVYSRHREFASQYAAARRCDSREAVWRTAVETLGQQAPVQLLEFGVYRGESIRFFSEHFSNPAARFTGFDSFEGLPEAWAGLGAGTFSTGGEHPQSTDARMRFVKGWFQDTVPGFLARESQGVQAAGPVLVHFDADLFSSTLFLLTALWHSLPEYHFVFDEFTGHELRAWVAFREACPVEASFLAYDLQDGYPCRLFGSLRRIPARVTVARSS